MIEIIEANRIERPGAYRMESRLYHADPCAVPSLSSGLARLMLDASPLHVWTGHPALNPKWRPDDGTNRLALGSVVHQIVLGAGAKIAHIEGFDDYRKKDAQALRDAAYARGETPVLTHQLELATRIARAAVNQVPPGIFSGGDSEIVIAAQDGPSWLRAQLDWWSADRLTIVDYKTDGGLVSPDKWPAKCASMGYEVQAAFYLRVLALAFPELAGRVRFLFVTQEIEPPYALATYEIAQADLFVAERKVFAAVERWAECMRADTWPAYPSGIQRVALPEWHARRWLDRELEEADSTRGDSRERQGDWHFASREA